jgi:predicted nucleic acid-binding protein
VGLQICPPTWMTTDMETKSNNIILDSSGIVSLMIETDSNHSIAVQALQNLPEPVSALLIPDAIFYECIDVIGKKFGHPKAMQAARWMLSNELIVVVNTGDIRERILELFGQQKQSVSIADCSVMVTADEANTNLIFGFDKVFQENHYIRLGMDAPEAEDQAA